MTTDGGIGATVLALLVAGVALAAWVGPAGAQELAAIDAGCGAACGAAPSSATLVVMREALDDLKALRQDLAVAITRTGGGMCDVRLAVRSLADGRFEAFGWCAERAR